MRLFAISAALLVTASCSSGDRGVRQASFAPDARTPAPLEVYLALVDAAGQSATLSVRVREVTGVGGADLRIGYDPYRVVFRGFTPGTLLESGGAEAAYQVAEQPPGVLRIVATRTAPEGVPAGADAGTDDPPLILLEFSVAQSGTAPMGFLSGSELRDPAGAALGGITFYGGALTGS